MGNASQDHGKTFEQLMCKTFSDIIRKLNCAGICYPMNDEGAGHQPIDLLIDSIDIGYIGIECKSTYEITDLAMWKLNRPGEYNIGQIERQHAFLRNAGRYGIMALEIRKTGFIYLVPHQYIFNKIERSESYLTMREIEDVSLRLHKNLTKDELQEFILNFCTTGAYYDPKT